MSARGESRRAARIALRPSSGERASDAAYRDARRSANHRIGFVAHGLVYLTTMLLLLVVTTFTAAAIVGLSWGILLVSHGYFAVAAPLLRRKWTEEEVAVRVASSVSEERRELEGERTRSLERLSASIAHEIRNPITAAKSLVAQMAEDPASAENAEYARVVLEELDRVERSITGLLKYAREAETAPRDTALVEVVESALDTSRARATKLGVTIASDVAAEARVLADPEKLRAAIIDLVENALDALAEASTEAPRVDLSSGENLAGTDVWLRVKDNGPGIPAELADRVFAPFFTTKKQGTGIGLASAKKSIEAAGGTIELASPPGQGAAFTLTLPKAK